MWLTNSSVGRKVVMSVTGVALILFLSFHLAMNLVALFSKEGYNMVCEFLGSNWYALVATAGLAALFLIHIVYAFWLTMQNRKARGSERYAVTERRATVEWASQNMLVLGIIVILGIVLHLYNFWYNMMFAELAGFEGKFAPTDGYSYIEETFGCPVFAVLYILWIIAIWFHLTHGFWSAMQTLGWNNKVWIDRMTCISKIFSTIICAGFILVIIVFCAKSMLGCTEASCCAEKAAVEATCPNAQRACQGKHEGCQAKHEGCQGKHEGCQGKQEGCKKTTQECCKQAAQE